MKVVIFKDIQDSGVCVFLSHVQLFAIPWTVAHQALLSMEFTRQEYWSGLPFPSPGSSWPRDRTQVFLYCKQMLYHLTYYGSPRYRGGNDKLEVLRHKGKPWRKGKQWHLPMGLVRVLVPKFFNLLVIVNLSWKMASTGTVWKSFLKTSYPLWVYCEPVRMSWSWRGVSIYDLKIEFYMSVYRERLRLARYHSTTWQCLTGGQYNPFISGQYDAHLKGSKIYEVLFCVLVMIDSSNYFSVYIL